MDMDMWELEKTEVVRGTIERINLEWIGNMPPQMHIKMPEESRCSGMGWSLPEENISILKEQNASIGNEIEITTLRYLIRLSFEEKKLKAMLENLGVETRPRTKSEHIMKIV